MPLQSNKNLTLPMSIAQIQARQFSCLAFQTLQVEPENYPDKKDALIGEFRNYLKILRAVHSGADLQSSAEAAGGNLPGNAKGFLGYVLSHQFDNQILPLIENAVEARTELQLASKGNRCGVLACRAAWSTTCWCGEIPCFVMHNA